MAESDQTGLPTCLHARILPQTVTTFKDARLPAAFVRRHCIVIHWDRYGRASQSPAARRRNPIYIPQVSVASRAPEIARASSKTKARNREEQ